MTPFGIRCSFGGMRPWSGTAFAEAAISGRTADRPPSLDRSWTFHCGQENEAKGLIMYVYIYTYKSILYIYINCVCMWHALSTYKFGPKWWANILKHCKEWPVQPEFVGLHVCTHVLHIFSPNHCNFGFWISTNRFASLVLESASTGTASTTSNPENESECIRSIWLWRISRAKKARPKLACWFSCSTSILCATVCTTVWGLGRNMRRVLSWSIRDQISLLVPKSFPSLAENWCQNHGVNPKISRCHNMFLQKRQTRRPSACNYMHVLTACC